MQQELEKILCAKVNLVYSQTFSKQLKPIIDQEKLLLYGSER
jgi:predicted nucleotidyltransferase